MLMNNVTLENSGDSQVTTTMRHLAEARCSNTGGRLRPTPLY